ncbi:Non-hem dioxygenase N-terminal domain [Arabidopsis thaliana x Arabidopsis arenosa]|uniref:Non-hem dioxygenase N-terminal domain n=1 Tax=Arabidopsis thaliana x Arabidopsis arenosa TaxID=1240361 RepID=A0A8T2A7D5_9BRAS|nr:Non-hem dioxygenase N-terminal domain [Arabidopsis thaliana x Arabidopsis arenosa]
MSPSESTITNSGIISDNMVLERDQDIPSSHIPVVDLSNPDQELVARAVVKASEEWGVFQVVNHGIPTKVIQRLQNVGRQFFELSEEEKNAVAKPDDSREGYARRYELDLERKTGTVDQLFHNIWPPSSVNYKYWPKNPLDYREANEEYTKHVKMLSEKIMEWLSEGLGLWGEAIKEVISGEYMMIVNYYPPCPHSDLIEGLDPHTDVSGLTLILPNEIPGLQVFKDDHWFGLENIPSAVIVIIGDQIERLSNGRYKSVLHKTTVDKERTRMSWPVLVRPTNDMVVGPFPEIIGHDNPPKFKHIAYKDYIYRKLRHLSFADLDS